MKGSVGFAALLMLSGFRAEADPCAAILAWLQPPHPTFHLTGNGFQPDAATGPAFCGATRTMSGTVSSYCAWPFAYRAEAAQLFFQDLSGLMESCIGPAESPPPSNTDVNHPDSYTLRQYKSESGTVFASLKDKGGQAQSLVFLRFEPAP